MPCQFRLGVMGWLSGGPTVLEGFSSFEVFR